MSKQTVLLIGATGETGGSILNGLLERGTFEVTALVRLASAEKPGVKELTKRGVKILVADVSSPIDELVPVITGTDILISAIGGTAQLDQINLITAAKKAGVKRFVPCDFASIAPPGGVMVLRDEKEEVHKLILKLFLGYTFIDVGFWYQLSFPRLPSGRTDNAIFPGMQMPLHGDGKVRNLVTDIRDIGKFVALIVNDERTLNKYVYGWGDLLSDNDIYDIMEEVSGEKLERIYVPNEETEAKSHQLADLYAKDPSNIRIRFGVMSAQYSYSKYVRGDNTPEYAKYLGYLDARELYPDFKPTTFKEFVVELLDGKVPRPYANRSM
ncbi:isoflavone reductase family protein [Cadophora sp. MPI-SDFR-AT-0126]|nr:isoflavone reductase family protein [Leotiomycetes sp. MPI-SDFR-AT-0126]